MLSLSKELFTSDTIFYLFLFFLMFLFIFESERETEHEQGRSRERGRHRIRSRLQAPSCQHRARCGARTHEPWDHDLSRSQTLNRLSHPGAPHDIYFKHLFIFETEIEHEQGRGRERGRHRIRSRLQASSCQHRAQRRARTHKPQDHGLSRSQMLNWLSHRAPWKVNS